MAILKLNKNRLTHNFNFLKNKFEENHISWGIVSKLMCGNPLFLKVIIDLGVEEMHDTRIINLKTIKKINPNIQTVYIKPPAKRSIKNVVKFADVSFNTQLSTIELLSEEAQKQNRLHKIIIMIEMGDLREGVMGDNLMDFYEKIFLLPNIEVIGIGTNLNCLNGIMPNQDKLIQLSLYKQLIEAKFNREIPWISGGTSVTLALLLNHKIPKEVNHFRVGEALFFGNDLFTGKTIKDMKSDIFVLYSEIIEIHEKPMVPIGDQGENVSGETPKFNKEDVGKTSYRAILDIGLLDLDPKFITPKDTSIDIIEASSDMLVMDLKENTNGYKTGDLVSFHLKYMAVLGLMNSNYIEKVID